MTAVHNVMAKTLDLKLTLEEVFILTGDQINQLNPPRLIPKRRELSKILNRMLHIFYL